MLTAKEKLESLAHLGVDLNQTHDLDMLMEQVLTKARQFVNADAGSIYIRDGRDLHFSYTQNDTLQKRLASGEKLIYSTFTIPIDEKSIAGYVALTARPLNIEDVYQLDESKPFHFSKQFDEASRYRTGSVLTLPLKNAQGAVLGVLQIINAQNESREVVPFSLEDEKMMNNFGGIAAVALERAQMSRSILLRMIKMAEMRDPKETGAHVNRVGGYAVELYERWAMRHEKSRREIDKNRDILRMAAMLHDVGKVAITDLILKKPGKFNHDEYETMKRHTVLGARLFHDCNSEFDEAAMEIALNHHEWWNGKGYPGHVDIVSGDPLEKYKNSDGSPMGKVGDETPVFGRIVALADVYDALSSVRIYKEAWDENKVLSTIEQGAGTQFDPDLVDIFFSSLDMMRSIQSRYQDR
jgi:response regulator RpfG family c-di-GMP phosphodiesterase